VTGKGKLSGKSASAANPYFATASAIRTNPAGSPAVTITKSDSQGHPADTAATEASLPNGSTGLVFVVANTGAEALVDVTVTDQLVANGTVTDLNCTFPDGTKGTTWAGPFAIGAVFTCTAQLSGVLVGYSHEDIGTVNAEGAASGSRVSDSNAYFAIRPAAIVIDTGRAGNLNDAGPVLTALGALLMLGGVGSGIVMVTRRRRSGEAV
jgi:hypothetical protein